jgi:hypothetical protein
VSGHHKLHVIELAQTPIVAGSLPARTAAAKHL